MEPSRVYSRNAVLNIYKKLSIFLRFLFRWFYRDGELIAEVGRSYRESSFANVNVSFRNTTYREADDVKVRE